MIITWGHWRDGFTVLGLGYINQWISAQDDTELPDPTLIQARSEITTATSSLITARSEWRQS